MTVAGKQQNLETSSSHKHVSQYLLSFMTQKGPDLKSNHYSIEKSKEGIML